MNWRQIEGMLFCHVPPGPFDMGSGDDDGMAFGDEKPLRADTPLDYGYWIAQHPVTNAQFNLFIKAGGYAHADYWKEAAALGLWRAPGEYAHGIYQWNKEKQDYDRIKQYWLKGPWDFSEPYQPAPTILWWE